MFPRALWHRLLRYILIRSQMRSTQPLLMDALEAWPSFFAEDSCCCLTLFCVLLSFAASLQVDIVPSQGEISVGESKFFLCQGE